MIGGSPRGHHYDRISRAIVDSFLELMCPCILSGRSSRRSGSVCEHRKLLDMRVGFIRTRPAFQVCFEFFAELLDHADYGHGSSVAERAEGAPQHVLAEVAQVIDVLHDATTGVKADERLLQPVGTFATGNAPATTLVLIELDGAEEELDDAGLVVEDDDAAGAEERAGLHQGVEVHREVALVRFENRHGRTARNDSFECAALPHTTADVVDHLVQVVAEW